MALKATVFKATAQVSDMDRGYYAEHTLTLARHPSETDERMMVRLLAFVLHADEALEFTRGLCADDDPDLWQRTLDGRIALWIDVGLPDAERVRKASRRAERVVIYAYGARAAPVWWKKVQAELSAHDNVEVVWLEPGITDPLAAMAQRSMHAQFTLQEGHWWLDVDGQPLDAELVYWQRAAGQR